MFHTEGPVKVFHTEGPVKVVHTEGPVKVFHTEGPVKVFHTEGPVKEWATAIVDAHCWVADLADGKVHQLPETGVSGPNPDPGAGPCHEYGHEAR